MTDKMTVSCGNVFEDLGFPPDKASAMQVRGSLLIALEKELSGRGKKQQGLADDLGIRGTHIPEVLNHKSDCFSLDKRVGLLQCVGRHVDLVLW